MTDAPALVQNGRLNVLAANRLGLALYSEMDLAPPRPANHARFVFLDPRAQRFFLDWERAADDTVAMLRAEAGRDPHDRNLSDLVGELSTRSDDFRTPLGRTQRPRAPDRRQALPPSRRRRPHPHVRDARAHSRPRPAAPRLSAEPGSASHDALNLLGSWAATVEPATTPASHEA